MAVVINTPASGVSVKGVVNVTATYSGNNFDVATVTIDGKQLGSDAAQPIGFSIDTAQVGDGAHTLAVAVRYRSAGGKMRWQKASVPITVANGVSQWETVALEGAQFTLAVAADVRYGAGSTWAVRALAAGTYRCDNATFGDPLVGTSKHCEAKPGAVGPPPLPPNQTRSAPSGVVT